MKVFETRNRGEYEVAMQEAKAQERADADQGKAHLDSEVLKALGREIAGVGIIETGETGQKHLGDIIGLDIG